MRKEDFMAPLKMQLMDQSHIKEIKDVSLLLQLAAGAVGGALGRAMCGVLPRRQAISCVSWYSLLPLPSSPSSPSLQYLTAVSDPRGGEECMDDTVYREG